MQMGPIARFRDWFRRPRLDWVQVEITTDCNARCVYCPTAVLGADWPRKIMPLATFERILPDLARATRKSVWRQPLLHLQGWGEPLLNPDFFAMVEAAKRAGCEVSTTCNGTRVDAEASARLVESGIDIVSFSLAGTDRRNDAIRRGTRLDDVMAAIARLDHEKRRRASKTPSLHISYMLLTSGLDAADGIPGFFRNRGIDHIVISTLSHVPVADLGDEAVLPEDETEYRTLDRRFSALAEEAAAYGMGLHYRFARPERPPGLCVENVQAALVVTVDGDVTPCVLNRFAGDGDSRPASEPFIFGNLLRGSLAEIWWREPYLRFRRSFWDAAPPPRCLACTKLGRS